MRKITFLSASLVATVAPLLFAAPAEALPRTWVASNGSGATCSRTLPCASFLTAYTATDVGGEVNCVDGGDFGGLIITKSITIDCGGTLGGGQFIEVNAPGGVVRLRNLTMEGNFTGLVGISFLDAAVLVVENVAIHNFNFDGGGYGILVSGGGNATRKLFVSDTTITNNGSSSNGGGIVIAPSGSASVRAVLNRVTLEGNRIGLFALGANTTGTIIVEVRDSIVAGSTSHGILAQTGPGGANPTGIVIDRSSSTLNTGNGIMAQGAGALVHLSSSKVRGNAGGLIAVGGGQILSYGDNHTKGNGTDGGPTGVLTPN